MQKFLQNDKYFVSVVTFCDLFFYSRFKRLFALMFFLQNRFQLKK